MQMKFRISRINRGKAGNMLDTKRSDYQWNEVLKQKPFFSKARVILMLRLMSCCVSKATTIDPSLANYTE
jgi:hypothetical protein